MKRLILFWLLLPLLSFSAPVSYSLIRNAAINAFQEIGIISPQVSVYEVVKSEDETPLFYIFNLDNGTGFVLISADDRIQPVLGYSTVNDFGAYPIPPALDELMEIYSKSITEIINLNLKGNENAKKLWKKYGVEPEKFENKGKLKDRSYLLGNINWDQGCGWNSYCPVDSDGPCGHVWAGCIATAAGMVMKYWEYPPHGIGSHTYTENDYGELSADFENTTYDWANMEDDNATNAAALLLFHFGVAVEMDYSPDGSGAYFGSELSALQTYFAYSEDITYKERAWYNDQDWIALLKQEIDNLRPIPYKGSGSAGGHAFVCDGYDSNNNFHFNWGWSGWYNGYYSINNLNPGGNNFTEDQAAGFNVKPQTPKPENLNATLQENNGQYNVVLTWDAPETMATIAGYRIYNRETLIGTTTQTTFTDVNVPAGIAIYNVRTVYNFPNVSELLSEPSTFTLVVPTSVDTKQDFKIAPNPVKNYINLNVPYVEFSCEVYDLTGKKLLETENEKILDISEIDPGVYLLKITNGEQIWIKKFIKQ